MNLPFFIAKRYLVSKKKQNIINIISGISMAGIVVGTMAIIIVVSVINGFSEFIGIFYSDFDPDLKITVVEGKMFDPAEVDVDKLKAVPGVVSYAQVIEEIAMIKYGKQQYPAVVKGVPSNYAQYTNIEDRIVDGKYSLKEKGINYAVVGRGVAYNLGVGVSFLDPIRIYVPKKGKQMSLNPARAINIDYIFPSGIFANIEDIDGKYILVSNEYAANLFDSGKNISAIELDLDDSADLKSTQKTIKEIMGDGFHVKNKEEQHDLVFKTMKSEKWVTYAILVFILLLASGNMIGNLTMLYIDKKEDISILRSMGLSMKKINRIFLYEGWLISFIGGTVGTVLGAITCWLQIKFALIKLPAGTFAISAYPVQIIFTDILLAFLAVMVIGFLASWYPVKFISQKHLSENNIN
ncbi:MAG: FtsX-like permease family protein [Bacteroidota bacterium]